MNIKQLKEWESKGLHYSSKADDFIQKIAIELQKICDFEIKFGVNDPSDGIVFCYDSDDYTDCHITLDTVIRLYQTKNRKLRLSDIVGNY